ncbi:MAG: serine hydrolase, partial [Betaproteobacteria bacterium]|nr:serine hydrolase [Betaproteobacteria bacterium]
MRKVLLAALVVLLGAAGLAWLNLDSDMRALLLALPTNRDVLFWSPAQRDAAFRTMDRVPLL